MLFKNVASQKIHVYAYDSTTGAAKVDDEGQITAYVSLDGTANAIDDTNPAQVDKTNMPGIYVFDLTQAETNCNSFALYAKSSTSNIRIEPIIGFTTGAAATQTGDSYAVVAHTDYGNAKLVRSTTPANTLSVDAAHKIPSTIAAGDIANDAITAAAIATGAIDADAIADNAIDAGAIATGAITNAKFAAGAIDAAAIANGAIDAATFAADVDAEIAAMVWNAATASYGSSGSYGEALEAAGSAADPWLTPLPGGYAAGTAGYIIGGFSASSDPWGVELPGSYTGIEAGKILADLSAGVNVTEWRGTAPAVLTDTDKVQVSLQHVKTALLPSTSDIAAASANAVWDEATADHVTAGSAGKAVVDVLADTGTDIPATLSTIGGYLDIEVAAILEDTGTTLPATLATILADTAELQTNQGNWLTATGFATPTNITAATGVVLASTGLDSIATTAPTGVASNFREMVVQTWRRFFKKSTLTATELKTYDDAGTGVLTTQTVSDDTTIQTQGTAS